MRHLRTISIIISTASLMGVIIWLVAQNLVPFGVLTLHWQPGQSNSLIGPLVPESRLSTTALAHDGTPFQTLIAEPVNFNVRLPISFDTAKVSVVMAGNPAIVELGGLASRATWTNDLRPGLNSIIDNLGWETAYGKGLTLYERQKTYSTVDGFLAEGSIANTAVYRANADFVVNIPGYIASNRVNVYQTAFRGATTIKVYLQDEVLDFAFKVQDVNRHPVDDGFEAAAYLNGERIARANLSDDGNQTGDGKLSPLRDLRLYTENPITGVVRIDLPVGDDIVFRQVSTTQQKFIFASRFYAADNVGFRESPATFSIVTNGKRLYATTAHPPAFQTLKAGDHSLVIDDVNKPFTVSVADAVEKTGFADIVSPYGDLRLETAGVFAFTRANFFNPEPQPLTWESDVDRDGIDYILTSYVPPSQGEWRTAEATFDLRSLSAFNRSYNFTISAPGLEMQNKELRIASIDIELRRPPFTLKDAFSMLMKLFKK